MFDDFPQRRILNFFCFVFVFWGEVERTMAGEDWIELKFRLADGSDIGPTKYNQSMTVSSLKEKIISQWPKGIIYTLLFSQLHSFDG